MELSSSSAMKQLPPRRGQIKNAGAALSDYGHGETQVTPEMEILHSQHQPMDPASEPPPPPPPHLENLNLPPPPPPPPPLPIFTPSPIKRATSMPAMSTEARKMGGRRVGLAIAEEDEEEEDHEHDDEDESHKGFQRRSRNRASETTSSPYDYFFTVDDMPGPSLSEKEEAKEFGEDAEEEQALVVAGAKPNSEEWIFLVTNLCMEILSAACDQASSPSRPRYALFGMLLAIAALLTCICELIYKGRKNKVVWRKRGCCMFFGSVIELFGLVGGITQCVCSIIQYVYYIRHAENPIKLSLLPAIFLICLIPTRLSRKRVQTRDETGEHTA